MTVPVEGTREDLLSGTVHAGELVLPRYGVAALREVVE